MGGAAKAVALAERQRPRSAWFMRIGDSFRSEADVPGVCRRRLLEPLAPNDRTRRQDRVLPAFRSVMPRFRSGAFSFLQVGCRLCAGGPIAIVARVLGCLARVWIAGGGAGFQSQVAIRDRTLCARVPPVAHHSGIGGREAANGLAGEENAKFQSNRFQIHYARRSLRVRQRWKSPRREWSPSVFPYALHPVAPTGQRRVQRRREKQREHRRESQAANHRDGERLLHGRSGSDA